MEQNNPNAVPLRPQRRPSWAILAIVVAFVAGIVVGFVKGE
jgi:hypothetical protein